MIGMHLLDLHVIIYIRPMQYYLIQSFTINFYNPSLILERSKVQKVDDEQIRMLIEGGE